MRRRLAGALCLVLLVVAPAAPSATAPAWTYAASDSFEVYTTGGDRRAREALVYFERVRAIFTDFLKLSPKAGNPTRLIIFSGAREFAPYQPNEVASAFYQPGPDRDYIVMRSFDADSFPLIVHEYAHLVFRHAGAEYPPWLNEGLAEFFSTLTPDGGQIRLGRVPLGRLQYLASGVKLIPLSRLLAIDQEAPEYNTKGHAGVFYSESWALTHMLLTDPEYRSKTTRFLDLMAGGAPGAATLESVYGTTLASIQKELNGYIGQSSYRYFIAPYKAPKDLTNVPVRAATTFEAALVTANLLAATRDRDADARAALDALAREQPDSLPLAESRAFFEMRRHQDAGTVPFLARAVELGSRNAELHRAYAFLIERDDAARAETLLRTAVTLEPDDIDGRLGLAEMLYRRRDAEGALAVVAGLTHVAADDAFRLFRLLASANAMADKLDAAKAAAARLQEIAKPGGEATYAQQLAESIDAYIRRRAEVDRALREASAGDRASAPTATGAAAATGATGTAGAPVETPPAQPPAATPARPLTPGGLLGRDPALYATASGRFRNLVCGSGAPIVEVETTAGTLRLVIDNSAAVQVLGRSGAQIDLKCGTQDVPLKVSYEPVRDAALKTMGKVRVLDFRKSPRP